MPQPARPPRKPRKPGWYLEPRRRCCNECAGLSGVVKYGEPRLPHPGCGCKIRRVPLEVERTEVVSVQLIDESEFVSRMEWAALCNCSTPSFPAPSTRGKNVHLFEFPPDFHDEFQGEPDVREKIRGSEWTPFRAKNEFGRERDYVHHELPAEKCVQFNYKVTMRNAGFVATVKYTVFKAGTDEVISTFEDHEKAFYRYWVSMDLDEDSGFETECRGRPPVDWNQ